MTVQEKIFMNIQEIGNPKLLYQILKFIELLKQHEDVKPRGNIEKIKKLAGTLPDENAAEMKKIINDEFNNIEGEW